MGTAVGSIEGTSVRIEILSENRACAGPRNFSRLGIGIGFCFTLANSEFGHNIVYLYFSGQGSVLTVGIVFA
jgi:hypothetical protein